jgi:hypothetical protein
MTGRSIEELRDELNRLMQEQIESLQWQTFVGHDEDLYRHHQERLKRIREVAADFLAALRRSNL